MPKIEIHHEAAIEAGEAFKKIKTFFDGEDIRRIDSKIQCQFKTAML